MSAYGVPDDADGMMPWPWVSERLVDAHNYWVVTGGPHTTPVWGLWRDDTFVFSCGPGSRKAREIARDPHVVVHLESGADVVIVEGVAEQIESDAALAADMAAKYGPNDGGGEANWYVVRPQRAFAWQEASFPASPTRFDF